MFAAVQKKKLYAVNCHMHTETSDFLGGLRPARREKNTDKVDVNISMVCGSVINLVINNIDVIEKLFKWCKCVIISQLMVILKYFCLS